MSYYCMHNISNESKDMVKKAFALIAGLSEALIFFLVGQNVPIYAFTGKLNFAFVFFVFFLIVIVRAVVVFPISAFLNCVKTKNKIPLNFQVMIWHSGLRGAIAFALSISFPSQNQSTVVGTTMMIM